MSKDRELLEMAAKAAGIRLEWDGPPDQWGPMHYHGKTYHEWNPLDDDGEALRLAVKRRFTIKIADHEVEIFDGPSGECLVSIPMRHPTEEELQENVRRAITTAAAEIERRELASRAAES